MRLKLATFVSYTADMHSHKKKQDLPLFRQMAAPGGGGGSSSTSGSSFAGAGSVYRTAREAQQPLSSSSDNMPPADSGRALGGATRRGGNAADARAARLEALDKRQNQQQGSSS